MSSEENIVKLLSWDPETNSFIEFEIDISTLKLIDQSFDDHNIEIENLDSQDYDLWTYVRED